MSGVEILIVTCGALPPSARTPRRPSAPRVSGMIASGPASPMRPVAPRIGNGVAWLTTPPLAKGITRPCAKAPPLAKGIRPETALFRPLDRSPPSWSVTGFIAAL